MILDSPHPPVLNSLRTNENQSGINRPPQVPSPPAQKSTVGRAGIDYICRPVLHLSFASIVRHIFWYFSKMLFISGAPVCIRFWFILAFDHSFQWFPSMSGSMNPQKNNFHNATRHAKFKKILNFLSHSFGFSFKFKHNLTFICWCLLKLNFVRFYSKRLPWSPFVLQYIFLIQLLF